MKGDLQAPKLNPRKKRDPFTGSCVDLDNRRHWAGVQRRIQKRSSIYAWCVP